MANSFDVPWSGIETSGRVCLSFINTLDWRLREEPVELLVSYDELLRWARTAGVLAPTDSTHLRESGIANPTQAARWLAGAVRVREAMAAVFLAGCRGAPILPEPLEILDRCCRKARVARALRVGLGRVEWTWLAAEPEAQRPMWAAALDASDLLTSEDLDRVRLCEDDECGWLFLDGSRNRSRRWCSMESCGNRNKARTFYRRRKTTG